MNYPTWVVPGIGLPWVIGIIAIIHIPISHFAIGGGLYLPLAEAKALREGRGDWLEALRAHSRFFLILTGVAGALTGVGIWFAIGLSSPEATSTLIHNFVFAWAIEWVFFIVELTAIAVYCYGWDRLSPALHRAVGWVYFVSAWLSLAVINGILSFMLTPSEGWLEVAGTGQESSRFWQAFFNPTYLPSLALRTLACIALAGVFALLTAGRLDPHKQADLKESLARWSAQWILPAFFLMPLCLLWYLAMVPGAQRELLTIGIPTMGAGMFTQVTRAVVISVVASALVWITVYVAAWLQPRSLTAWQAVGILSITVAAVGGTEHAREMIRKPYVIGDHMYSNGVRLGDVDRYNTEGYLARTIWLTTDQRERPGAPENRLAAGEIAFRGQCMSCHTLDGYRAIRPRLEGRDRASVRSILTLLEEVPADSPYRQFMPRLVGADDEIEALCDYLVSITPPSENGATPAGTEVQPQ